MDSIYKRVSKTVAVSSEPIQQSSKQDVEDLITETVPKKRRKDEIETLQHKSQLLDSVKQKWKRTSNKRVRNIISCKDKRQLKVFDIKKDEQRFKDYIPLHRLWQDYMRDTIDMTRLTSGSVNQNRQTHERLLKADFHGCMIVVKKTKCPSLLGLAGIVLMETRNTFKIITKADKIKCVPKANCVFAFELDGLIFSIYGNQFLVKASERVKRAFKLKGTIDIT